MKRVLWAGAVFVTAGCASYPAPTGQVATSMAATRGAEEAGALLVPEAALHLKLAQEQIANAKQAMEEGDNKRAEGLAARAQEDAELALALAHEQKAKSQLDATSQAGSSGGEQGGLEPGGPANTGGAPATTPEQTPSTTTPEQTPSTTGPASGPSTPTTGGGPAAGPSTTP